MSIFKEMHELRTISKAGFLRLKGMIADAISRGYVEQIPVMKPNPFLPNREWYRDKETGEIYFLDPPGERGGCWDRVDPKDLIAPDEKVH
jgi:hypothetical protein